MKQMRINDIPMVKESTVPWSVWLDLPEDTLVNRLSGVFFDADGKCIDEVYRIIGTDNAVAHYCNEYTEQGEPYDAAEILPLAKISHPSQSAG